jgi:ATP-binding cassette, subfamily B (MDR/TAP), member 1
MWEFALLAIGCVPLMGFATSIRMKQMLGEDQGTMNQEEGRSSPGGVVVETLLNMRTVSALTLEKQRFNDYEAALVKSEPNVGMESFMLGCTGGLSVFIQQWINALQFWFGGWLLVNTDKYEFKDFLISNFAVLFALFGLGSAFQDISDRKEVEKSAGRIFYLLDCVSEIDPLGKDGIVLIDGTIPNDKRIQVEI